MAVKTTRFDIVEELDDAESIAIYLGDALETGDTGYFLHALGKVAKARGMADLAREAGVTRPALYKALSEDGNPSIATIMAVTRALGVQLDVRPMERATGEVA